MRESGIEPTATVDSIADVAGAAGAAERRGVERRTRGPSRSSAAGPDARRRDRDAAGRGRRPDRARCTGSPRPGATSSTARGLLPRRGFETVSYDARGHGAVRAGARRRAATATTSWRRPRRGDRRAVPASGAACSPGTRWARTRWPRSRSREPERVAGARRDRPRLHRRSRRREESLALLGRARRRARERRGRRLHRAPTTTRPRPGVARHAAAVHARAARAAPPPRGGRAGAARGAALAAVRGPGRARAPRRCRRWSSRSHDEADPGHPYAVAEAWAERLPQATPGQRAAGRVAARLAGRAPVARDRGVLRPARGRRATPGLAVGGSRPGRRAAGPTRSRRSRRPCCRPARRRARSRGRRPR